MSGTAGRTHLDESTDQGRGKPGCNPFLVVPDLEVEALEGDRDAFDREESFLILLRCVLEGDVEAETFRSELDVEQTGILEGCVPRFDIYPESDIGGLQMEP